MSALVSKTRKALAALALGLLACATFAQDARTIHVIVPLLPGAGTDVVARTFTAALAQGLGQPIVVENKAGAATTLGTNFVAKSAPDGLTLLVATTSTLSVLPNVQKPPYDTLKDLLPIAAFSISPFVVVVAADSRFNSLPELIAAARAEPGKLTFASSGTGTMTHMVVELLGVVARMNMVHIPYKGVTGAYADVIGGRIDLLADAPASTLPQIRGKRMRALALTAPQRSAMLPGVPTVGELGLAGAEADFITGLLAPTGTPAPILARLQAESLKVAQSAEFRGYLRTQGYEPLSADGAEFGRLIRAGLAKWAGVVRERNIKLE
ncbi:MAG: tripartite tricarboxylate transporter substrate binding protein [Betaproteobacteria bacterium]|nr:tripartite tricarboxylate transporter substrate binding protein [Betaproteobacteria bacterium]